MTGMKCKKTPVQPYTFLSQDTRSDFYPPGQQFVDPLSIDRREWIPAPNHNPWYLFFDYEVGTRRGLAKMSTGFQRHIHCGSVNQGQVLLPDGSNTVGFRMRLSILPVIALPYDAAFAGGRILIDQHSPYHWIGCGMTGAQQGQFKAAVHICFVRKQGAKLG